MTTHQIRRVWKDPDDPTGRRDIHGPWFDCPTCLPPRHESDDVTYLRWWANPEDSLAAATTEKWVARNVLAQLDNLREAASLMLITLRAHGVPGGPVWNAYWNLHEEIHHDGLGKA